MEASKDYLQPVRYVLTTVYDIAELLQGSAAFCDAPKGVIVARVQKKKKKWDVVFAVKDIGHNRSRVTVRIVDGVAGEEEAFGDGKLFGERKELRSIFALLDSMLLIEAEIEFTENG
jgi:hypothetical protein